MGLAWLLIQGCASYSDKTAEIRGFYQTQNYAQALAKLDESSIKSENKNRLLYQLERAQILDRQGDLKASRAALLRADKIADDLYTTSISHQVASFLVNDAATEYGGEDFEIVAIHIALALSFLESDDLKGALVEARKINSKLAEINQRYDKNKNRYAEDAFARFLAGLIYEASGNYDSAIIDYRKSIKTYDSLYSRQFGVAAPRSLIRSYVRALQRRGRSGEAKTFLKSRGLKLAALSLPPASYGRVVVIHEVGTINRKVNSEHLMPWSNKTIRFSFPHIAPTANRSPLRFKSRHSVQMGTGGVSSSSGVAVELGGQQAQQRAKAAIRRGLGPAYGVAKVGERLTKAQRAEPVQDMNAIAHHTLEDRRGRIFAKSVARLVVKDQMVQKANQEWGPVAGLLVGVAGMVTETGDTRSWALLPGGYEISELYLPAGRHNITIIQDGLEQQTRRVNVRAGRPVFVRAK